VDRLVRWSVETEPEEQAEIAGRLGALRRREQIPGCGRELAPSHVHAVVLVDAGDVPHDLPGGAVGGLLLVRQAPAPYRPPPRALDPRSGFAGDPRLADPGGAEDRH